jgi:hypothetical protein
MARKSITEIISEVIGAIDKTIKIDSFTDDSITQVFTLCSLKWLEVGTIVSDGSGNTSIVTAIDRDLFIVTAQKIDFQPWITDTLTIDVTFHYIFGSRMSVNAEWLQLDNNENNKLPLFCLVMPTRETNEGFEAGLERESNIVLYVLNYCTWQQTNQVIQDEVIRLLWLYVAGFLQAIESNYDFKPISGYDTRELSRFGTETLEGFDSEIFDSNLSAIEMRFALPIRKGASICKC